jgi:hypothetical protein
MAEIPLYTEGEAVPGPRPRAEVRFTSVSIAPLPDGRRMRLSFGLTPFAERPNVELTVTNAAGLEVANFSLVEAMDTAFDFTVHLRGPLPAGPHTLRLELFYRASDEPGAAHEVVDTHTLTFHPAGEAAG